MKATLFRELHCCRPRCLLELRSPDIDFTVTSPDGNTVHNLEGTAGDKFDFKVPIRGMYKFCFQNSYSTPETVLFYIHVGHILNEHNIAKDEHLDPANVKIAELGEALESVTAEQNYLKARTARQRHLNESTEGASYFIQLGNTYCSSSCKWTSGCLHQTYVQQIRCI